jgi:hypothetical protein
MKEGRQSRASERIVELVEERLSSRAKRRSRSRRSSEDEGRSRGSKWIFDLVERETTERRAGRAGHRPREGRQGGESMVGETASSSSPNRRLVPVSAPRKSVRVRPARPKAVEVMGWRLIGRDRREGKAWTEGQRKPRRIVSPPPVEWDS